MTEEMSLSVACPATEPRNRDPVTRVTPLELFFDLVFVFTITQLTALLVARLTWVTLWHVAVLLALIFYMYDGYAWLTNAVPARGVRRQVLLLGGMAGYLVIAIALPHAYDTMGVAFGLAYLMITLIHAFLFVRAAATGPAAAMRRLGPANTVAALAVVIGGIAGGDTQAVVWTLVALCMWFLPAGGVVDGFEVGPAHFVERHGLLVIVAIGESVVAIGAGATGRPLDAAFVGLVALGLLLCAGLWWAYFGQDDDLRIEQALRRASRADRARIVLRGFGYAHYVLLLGIVLLSVGIEDAVAHPDARLTVAIALALSGGVALFQAGNGWFRATLGLAHTRWRMIGAGAVLLAMPIGITVSAAAGLAAVTVLLLAALVAERGAS